MNALNVQPKAWQNENYPIRELYDDGEYSVIWGKYKDIPSLGVRWNGANGDEIGYPRQGDNPTWYIEPDFIATAILQRLLTYCTDAEHYGFLDNILFAIGELNNKLSNIDN